MPAGVGAGLAIVVAALAGRADSANRRIVAKFCPQGC